MVDDYKNQRRELQVELVKLQRWVQKHSKRVLIILEGRDTAGKGGMIRRFTRYKEKMFKRTHRDQGFTAPRFRGHRFVRPRMIYPAVSV